MPTKVRRATAQDVAAAAGVSKTTVSYVLNNVPHQTIPEATRRKVLDAVEALGYAPSSAARALRTGRDNTVLLLLPDWPISGPVSAVIEGLLDELDKHGLALKTRRDGRKDSFSSDWLQVAPQAVVALHELDADDERAMRASGIFVAHALLTGRAASGHNVVFPQELVGAMQVQHLAAGGRHRTAFIAPRDPRLANFAELRIDGARAAASDLGLPEPLVEHIDPTRDEAVTVLEQWAGLTDPVTGIAAYNDHFAAAVLAAARDLQIPVPGRLAVIGVDNDPLSEFTAPPLTTIDQHTELIAANLATLIVDGIAGAPPQKPAHTDAVSLIVRESA